MTHRRRRSNPVIRPSEAAALRALLSRHGYRVNARPNENQIETVRIVKRRNPKAKRKTTWRSRWKSRAEMEAYMAKIRRKSKKVRLLKRKTAKRGSAKVRRPAIKRKTYKRRHLAKRKTVKRRRVMKRKTAKHRSRR